MIKRLSLASHKKGEYLSQYKPNSQEKDTLSILKNLIKSSYFRN